MKKHINNLYSKIYFAKMRAKAALENHCGEGYIDSAVKICDVRIYYRFVGDISQAVQDVEARYGKAI